MMIEYDAMTLAKKMMAEYGLHDWSFGWNHRKRGLGLCRYRLRRIELSRYYVASNDEAHIRNTILHEIAHALVGHGHGHNRVWRAKFISMGGDGQRCSRDAEMPKGRWQSQCPNCKKVLSLHRKPKYLGGKYCAPCGSVLGALPDFRLVG